MKIPIENYTFIPSTRSVVFNEYTTISLNFIYPIINVTTGTIIYNPMSPTLVGSVTDNKLILSFDTDSMDSTDVLMILYEDGRKMPTAIEAANAIDENSNWLLRRVVKLLESNAVVDSNSRQRITLDAMTGGMTLSAVTSVGSVGSVGNIVTIGSMDPRFTFIDTARNNYANSIRNNLKFT